MSNGKIRALPNKFFEEVAGAGGKAAFTLVDVVTGASFLLREQSLVFVDGQITDLSFTGVGTGTITFTPALIQGTKLTVKE